MGLKKLIDLDRLSQFKENMLASLVQDLDTKVDKVSGKGLSTEDYTTSEKTKLSGIETGAQANVQADWNATSGDAFIRNKPTIPTVPTNVSSFNNDAGYLTEYTVGASADNWLGDVLSIVSADTWILLTNGSTTGSYVALSKNFLGVCDSVLSAKKQVAAFAIPKNADAAQITDFDIVALADVRNVNFSNYEVEFAGISGGKLYSTVLSQSGNNQMTGTLTVTDLALPSAQGVSF